MSEFDRYATQYRSMTARSISASGEEPDYFAEYKAKDFRDCVERRYGSAAEVRELLDFGCGIGANLGFLRAELPGARVSGIDASAESIEIARRDAPRPEDLTSYDCTTLPYEDGRFDAVFAACVFHHIDPAQRQEALAELRRVLRPGGLLFVYEHNPYNPLTVRTVRSCPYDEGVTLLRARELRERVGDAGFTGIEHRYRVFFPHALAGLRPLERRLGRLPLGAQYFVSAVRAG